MAYYFKIPTYNDLNAQQKVAVDEEGPVAITGGPGTGKSVVAVWRHMTNYNSDLRKSILLTYTKSLRFFLAQSVKRRAQEEQEVAKKEKIENAGNNVQTTNIWVGSQYDEIIIDEAQDLPESQIDFWVRGHLNYIKQFADIISYGADNNQIVHPERSTTEERLNEIFPDNEPKKLYQNYRNTYEILNFSKFVLDYDINQTTLERLKEGEDKRRGMKPVLKLIDNDQQNDAILDIVNDFNDGTTNIAILLFFNNQFDSISRFLTAKQVQFSMYYCDLDEFPNIENVHLTTFKSAKGLEFDVVIIPEFESYERLINHPNYNVTDKDYYVAFTRAKRNLFLISENELDISESVLKREKFKVLNTVAENTNDSVPSLDDNDDLPF